MNSLKYPFIFLLLLPLTLQAQSSEGETSRKVNSLPQLIAQFNGANKRALPYGPEKFTYDFPKYWENDVYNGVQTFQDTVLNDLAYFNGEDSKDRLMVEIPYNLARQLVDSTFFTFSNNVETHGANFELKVAEISFSSGKFKVFSVRYEGYEYKDGCEYPLSQTHNLLITVDSKNRIIDKLLIAFADGCLDSEARYFYIDGEETIYLKDFGIGELSVSYIGCQKYRISQQGKLVNVSK